MENGKNSLEGKEIQRWTVKISTQPCGTPERRLARATVVDITPETVIGQGAEDDDDCRYGRYGE